MGSSACRFLTQPAYLDVNKDIKLNKLPLSFKVAEKRLPKSLRGLLNLLVLFSLSTICTSLLGLISKDENSKSYSAKRLVIKKPPAYAISG